MKLVLLVHPVGDSLVSMEEGPYRDGYARGAPRCTACREHDGVREVEQRQQAANEAVITARAPAGSSDGGLARATARLEHDAQRRRADAQPARPSESEQWELEEALRAQDVQVEKAVLAFLREARTIPPATVVVDAYTIRKRVLFDVRWNTELVESPGYHVHDESHVEDNFGMSYHVYVLTSGEVLLYASTSLPHRTGVGIQLASDEYVVEGPRVRRNRHGIWSRVPPTSVGALPFYVAGPRNYYGLIPLVPGPEGHDDVAPTPAVVRRTTDWFVETLAAYLHTSR